MRNRRRLVENTRSFHIRDMTWSLTNGVETVHLDDIHVQIAWRATPFGGKRAYFVCPECLRRTETLYRAPHPACRKCHRLAYRSENLTPLWRRNEKLRKLQEKAVADTLRLPCILAKPKWMRWHTYLSLRRKIQEADRNFAAAWMKSRHGAMLCRERAV